MSNYRYYLLTLADGSQVTINQTKMSNVDFTSYDPVEGDSPLPEIEQGTFSFIPAHVVSIEVK